MPPSDPASDAATGAISWPVPPGVVEAHAFADGLRLRAPFMAGDEFRRALRDLQEQHSAVRVRLSRTLSGDIALVYASTDLLEQLRAAIAARSAPASDSAHADEVE